MPRLILDMINGTTIALVENLARLENLDLLDKF